MDYDLQSLIEGWDGYAVVSRYDQATGAWIFIALHTDSPGGASGGTRIKSYDVPGEGLVDAMRLAEGMTYKWASINFDTGGAKAVIDIRPGTTGAARTGLLHRYGDLVESLRGGFSTGQDLGTSADDILTISQRTRHVHGVAEDGSSIDPSPFTAWGVYSGLRQALKRAFGSDDPKDRKVLIQGVGQVGRSLAQYLSEAGASVMVSDLDEARAAEVAAGLGGSVVPLAEVFDTECDVFAPCAIGGILSSETIPRLSCRVVAGSANNQLLRKSDAGLLHERGILYTPDYVLNSGGALAFGLMSRGEKDLSVVMEKMNGVGDSLAEIFAAAAEKDESPVSAATERARLFLARA